MTERQTMIERLETFTELEDGWWGQGTKAVDLGVMEKVRALVAKVEYDAIPPFHFAPTGDGEMTFELRDAEGRAGSADVMASGDMWLYVWTLNGPDGAPSREWWGAYDEDALLAFLLRWEFPAAESKEVPRP